MWAVDAGLQGSEFVFDLAFCLVEREGAFAAGPDFLFIIPFFVALVFVRFAMRDRRGEISCAMGDAFARWTVKPAYGGGRGGPDHVTATLMMPEGEKKNEKEEEEDYRKECEGKKS